MAFVLIAPGVRDVLAYPEVFAHRPIEETQATLRTQRVPGTEEEQAKPTAGRSPQMQHAQHRYEQAAGLPRERTPALLADQIMSAPVLTLGPDTLVRDAWAFFHEHRFRHVPVVNANRQLMGIVSERDLLRDAAGLEAPRGAPHRTISPLMEQQVLTATLDTEIREIAHVLFDRHIGAIPIINDKELPIGIVSRSDILQALVRRAPLELWV
ncbi:HPP family protein [Pseudomonadota bacterium]